MNDCDPESQDRISPSVWSGSDLLCQAIWDQNRLQSPDVVFEAVWTDGAALNSLTGDISLQLLYFEPLHEPGGDISSQTGAGSCFHVTEGKCSVERAMPLKYLKHRLSPGSFVIPASSCVFITTSYASIRLHFFKVYKQENLNNAVNMKLDRQRRHYGVQRESNL